MNAQELETAERVGAPFVTVVLEDESYSLIKLSQEGKKLEPYRVDFGRIDTQQTCACDDSLGRAGAKGRQNHPHDRR